MPILSGAHVCGCRASSGDFALPGAEAQYPPDLELEPMHVEVDLSVDLDAQAVHGTVTTSVEARGAGPRRLRLHAVDFADLTVRDADGRALEFTYDGRTVAVTWAEPFSAGETRRLAIGYRVEKPVTGLFFSKPEPGAESAPWYAATDHETERARHWLPCVDLPNVRPRLDLRLRAASRFTILANGALLSQVEHPDGTTTAHHRLEQRCPSYLTCFAIGDFVRCDDGDHLGKPISYFATKEFDASHLRRSFGRTPAMLAWLTAKLGCELPWPKYFQFALPGFGGAMENISLVSWDDVFILDERLSEEWTWLVDQINVHEMAHSFFGDWVVCRDFAHAWLKESWATYIESCWLEDHVSRDEADYDFFSNATAYITEADERYKRPIVTRTFDHSWSLYDRHLYPGGACRLHMLRRMLGDEVFWSAVRDYVQTFGGQVVETDDFRRVLEKHSGRSLGRFFDQWIFGKGYPSLEITFERDADKGEGTFHIEQKQVDDKDGVGPFHLELELGWLVDGRLETQRVELSRASHTVVVEMPKDPEQVRVDPGASVLVKLSFNPGDEKLRRQLRAPDVIGRIRAGEELAKTGRSKNLQAVREAYRAEPFWGVRKEWARALSKAGTDAALSALAELVDEETSPLVLEGVVRAAGAHRDSRIALALSRRLEAGLPYRAAAAALEGLGAQREAAPFEELARRSGADGFGGHVQSGALRALAATRRPEALDLLLERSRPGATSSRARPAAAAAIGELGRVLERGARERARERLEELLRDPAERVRRAALSALQTLGDAAAAPALEAYRASVSDQERAGVDRALASLRSAETPRALAEAKRLEELEAKVRKLDASLERLEARLAGPQGEQPSPKTRSSG
jgi:aminopeptidase N